MKRLIKTRKLINELIDEKTESKEGRPVPYIRLREVENELYYFEKGYFSFKFIAICYLIVIAIGIFFRFIF